MITVCASGRQPHILPMIFMGSAVMHPIRPPADCMRNAQADHRSAVPEWSALQCTARDSTAAKQLHAWCPVQRTCGVTAGTSPAFTLRVAHVPPSDLQASAWGVSGAQCDREDLLDQFLIADGAMRWLHAGRQAVSARLQCVVTHIAGGAPINAARTHLNYCIEKRIISGELWRT